MTTAFRKHEAPSYGTGFDRLPGLAPQGLSHRWYKANGLTLAMPRARAGRP